MKEVAKNNKWLVYSQVVQSSTVKANVYGYKKLYKMMKAHGKDMFEFKHCRDGKTWIQMVRRRVK